MCNFHQHGKYHQQELINELHQTKSKIKEKSTKVDSTPPVKNEQIEE